MGFAESAVIGGFAAFGGLIGYALWWGLQRRKREESPEEAEEEPVAEMPAMPELLTEMPLELPVDQTLTEAPTKTEDAEVPESAAVEEPFEEASVVEESVVEAEKLQEEDALAIRLTAIEETLRDMASAQATLLEENTNDSAPKFDDVIARLEEQALKLSAIEERMAASKNSDEDDTESTETLSAILAAIESLSTKLENPITERVLPHLALLSQDVKEMAAATQQRPSEVTAFAEEIASLKADLERTRTETAPTPPPDNEEETAGDGPSSVPPEQASEEKSSGEDEKHDAIEIQSAIKSLERETEQTQRSGIAYIPAQ